MGIRSTRRLQHYHSRIGARRSLDMALHTYSLTCILFPGGEGKGESERKGKDKEECKGKGKAMGKGKGKLKGKGKR